MKVILLERIERLGQMGDEVNVKPGFARNFLLPRKKALRATAENKRAFEQQRSQLEADNLQRRSEAEAVAKKMDGLGVVIVRQAGEAGQLYGSVSARDIALAVGEAGFAISRQQVRLNRPIKTVGLHELRVSLHPEVGIKVVANVARSAEEAEVQARTGQAVVYAEERTPESPVAEEAPEAAAPEAEVTPSEATSEEPDTKKKKKKKEAKKEKGAPAED